MHKVQFNIHTELFRQSGQLQVARRRFTETRPGKRLRILSFGSSIGEEIVTLRFMFPDADIFGCDIDDRVLEISRRSVGSLATIFKSSRDDIQAHGPFDLILASAVLCLNPTPENAVELFPVSRFDELVGMLDENLSYGGILIITNAAYRFTECPIAVGYDTIRADIVISSGYVDVFGRDELPYLRQVSTAGGTIYRRLGEFVPRDDEDLADSIFEKRVTNSPPAIHEFRMKPPPEGLEVLTRHTRLNIDWAKKQVPERCIIVQFDYDFCRVEATGEYGYIQTTSWASLVGEGRHKRPPTWHTVP